METSLLDGYPPSYLFSEIFRVMCHVSHVFEMNSDRDLASVFETDCILRSVSVERVIFFVMVGLVGEY